MAQWTNDCRKQQVSTETKAIVVHVCVVEELVLHCTSRSMKQG